MLSGRRCLSWLVTVILFVTLAGNPSVLFGAEVFPSGHLVGPPKVDPRAPTNHLKFFGFEDNDNREELLGAEVALTHNFGVSRWEGNHGVQYQFNCEAGVFSQFQESIDDFELVSSDFYVELPVEIRAGKHGFRASLYHLSSHLGDEFQERTGRERISFSHESLRGIYSFHPTTTTRFYVGGEYALRMTPDVGKTVVISGVEHEFFGKWFAGADLRSLERNDWDVASTLRVARYFGQRHFSVGLEFFDGPLPVGQFFREERTYAGITMTFKG